ncbi:hypothetical protein [Methylophilus sp. Leaf408]|uniref:hypothetical protein n=1 Tax=Methylophilus sp. Leaf408 TaxID=2876561 RepID=UPI001E2A0A98|nr:hypothetical protein [Methylophilus sp. Leaf408]
MQIADILNSPFTFTKRKNFTSCDTRPLWKSCLVVLVLGITGTQNSASLMKIHTANWIIKKDEHLSTYLNWAGKDDRKRPNVRLEPAIDMVINLLVSNGIAMKDQGRVCLTELGVSIFEKLSEEEVYIREKASLIEAKRYLSEAAVLRLFKGV